MDELSGVNASGMQFKVFGYSRLKMSVELEV